MAEDKQASVADPGILIPQSGIIGTLTQYANMWSELKTPYFAINSSMKALKQLGKRKQRSVMRIIKLFLAQMEASSL